MAGWSDSLCKQSPPWPLRAAMVGRGRLEGEGSSCHRIMPWALEDQIAEVQCQWGCWGTSAPLPQSAWEGWVPQPLWK